MASLVIYISSYPARPRRITVNYERLMNITTGIDGKTKTNPMDVTSVTQPVNKEMYVTFN